MAYGKKGLPILCVDFDGVLHSYSSGWKGARVIPDPPVDGAISWLIEAQRAFDVQIYSSRSRYFGGRHAMKKWLRGHVFNHVIMTLPSNAFTYMDLADDTSARVNEIMMGLKFPVKKPAAFVTLDDRCMCFNGEFPPIEKIKSFRPWNKNGK